MGTESTWVVLEGLGEEGYGEYVLTRYRVTFSDSVLNQIEVVTTQLWDHINCH